MFLMVEERHSETTEANLISKNSICAHLPLYICSFLTHLQTFLSGFSKMLVLLTMRLEIKCIFTAAAMYTCYTLCSAFIIFCTTFLSHCHIALLISLPTKILQGKP